MSRLRVVCPWLIAMTLLAGNKLGAAAYDDSTGRIHVLTDQYARVIHHALACVTDDSRARRLESKHFDVAAMSESTLSRPPNAS